MSNRTLMIAAILVTAVFLGACTGAAATANDTLQHMDMNNAGHDDNHDQDHDEDAGHDDTPNRVPNNGAFIHITSPADGATIAAGEDVIVEIETENITIGEDGNHWHVYVNGSSWGMVMGRNTSEVVRGLEPGEHKIEVYLSIESHEELEEGDGITISVAE